MEEPQKLKHHIERPTPSPPQQSRFKKGTQANSQALLKKATLGHASLSNEATESRHQISKRAPDAATAHQTTISSKKYSR